MKLKNYQPLKLFAADDEDLGVVSACLQDAVLKVGDMAFLPNERRFAFVTNRFIWEEGASRSLGPFVRVKSGIHFDDVTAVQSRNISLEKKNGVLSLLAIKAVRSDQNDLRILLEFAGGGEIALQVGVINCALTDISEPWRTQNKPDHGLD